MTLHIFGQPFNHADAWIIGDKESLVALRSAIDEAISGNISSCSHFAQDGEGYSIVVLNQQLTEADLLPYTHDHMSHRGTHPHEYVTDYELVKNPKFRGI